MLDRELAHAASPIVTDLVALPTSRKAAARLFSDAAVFRIDPTNVRCTAHDGGRTSLAATGPRATIGHAGWSFLLMPTAVGAGTLLVIAWVFWRAKKPGTWPVRWW
jgi:CBS-domain-containing membrane protein